MFDPLGKARRLGAVLARGGEGTVYTFTDMPHVLVKIPTDPTNASGQQEKIEAMLTMDTLGSDSAFAWPRITVLNQRNDYIGFGMRRMTGLSFHTLGNPHLQREKLPRWTRLDTVRVCLSFVEGLERLHQRGVLVGDHNPGNFLFDPHTHKVGFIDCDSYQVSVQSKRYLCPVGVTQYLAPEAQALDWSRTPRTVEQERFSAALMMYRLFMLGGHPYAHLSGDDPAENIRNGKCPLGTNSGCVMPRGPWYNIWSHLPYRMKNLFILAFRDGHKVPSSRPTLREWRQALAIYEGRLLQGHFSNELAPMKPKPPGTGTSSSTREFRGSRHGR